MRNLEKNTFTKEALALAWQYFLPPYAFQIRVGALYLLYGLYNTQLCQPKQKVKLDELFSTRRNTKRVQYFYNKLDVYRNASVSKYKTSVKEDLHVVITFFASLVCRLELP